ncbi:hypothetical protein [Lysobacter firmicutimachus]|uniref:Portal protein n=1 Tax=Lysobacter firmicutimachus TaxID=1792846 RepID=A0ABU8D0M7_9GAMM
MTDTTRHRDVAREVFWRLEELRTRGHETYMLHARRLEDYYLGGGRQWRAQDRRAVEEEGRPAHEVNVCLQAINAAAGYQIQNRVDMAYLPKGGRADEAQAKVLSKVIKHALENTEYRYAETDAFMDGIIQQRGYLDIRMDYSDNEEGEPRIITLDPLDVLPDADAKGYDPDSWADCTTTRWLTAFEIEQHYGRAAAQEIVGSSRNYCDTDNWWTDVGVRREGFASMPPSYAMSVGYYGTEGPWRRYRIVDRQANEYQPTLVARWPTGDLRIVEGLPSEHLGWLIDQGVYVTRRRMRRVRWQVCAPEVCLYDQLSPYEHITVVPYYPYFRRGRTIGMLDNAVNVQDILNKFISQYAHIVNASANGGWQGEANALANMTDEQFAEDGAQTGLVLLRKPNTQPFQKIEPNQPPTGIEKMIEFAAGHMQAVTAINESLNGQGGADMSGVAIQARQHAAQQALGVTLDNLGRTRKLVSTRMRKLVQRFMGGPRIIRISEPDPYGVDRRVPLLLNMPQEDGTILNDLTLGEYDVTVTEQPYTVTFDNSQFEQLRTMVKEMGVPIPHHLIVKASTLANKSEIADALREAEGKADPVAEAEAALKQAQARLAHNQAVSEAVETQFSALRTAEIITTIPQTAAIADALLRSAGFEDQDAAPIVPSALAGGESGSIDHAENTYPLTPDNPNRGLTAGMTATP